MISPERIAVATENDNSDRIELAPFSVEELEQYLPFSNEYKRFNPIGPEDTEQTAEKIVREQEALEHYLTWGIYVVNTSPANFIGTIAVSEINAGTDEEPYWSKTMQEVHTGIFAAEWRGRGIGTLSKLAVTSYIFDRHRTHAAYAQTSIHNVAAQQSLTNAGFSLLDTYEHFDFIDGGMTTYWMLADPSAQEHLPKDQEALAEGWNRFQAAHQKLTITYEGNN